MHVKCWKDFPFFPSETWNNAHFQLKKNIFMEPVSDAVSDITITKQGPTFKVQPWDADWTERFTGSVSKLRTALESGTIDLPATGVVLRSTRLTNVAGQPVYFRFNSKKNNKGPKRKIAVTRMPSSYQPELSGGSDAGDAGEVERPPDWTERFGGSSVLQCW